jgi:aryl-alcohol dehydrogenase-like predicted oxidoreductase
MRYKIFGQRTGLRVSELVLGTGMFGTKWGYGADPAEARRIFDGYVEAGGNFLDCADVYQFGEAESLLAEFVAFNRDDFVIATKYTLGAAPAGGISVRATAARICSVRSRQASGVSKAITSISTGSICPTA